MAQNTDTVDGSRLKKIFNQSDTAKMVLESLSERVRARPEISPIRLKIKLMHEGKIVDMKDYTDLWENLAKAGVGVLVRGRRGGPNRFIFNYGLKAVAKAAMEGRQTELQRIKAKSKGKKMPKKKETKEPAMVATPKKSEPVSKKTEVAPVIAQTKILIPFRGGSIPIVFPSDVTKEEIRSVADTLSSAAG